VHLGHQYRMNEEIMLISNELIYSHRLKCGNYQVATARLELPRLTQGLQLAHGDYPRCNGTDCWLEHVLNPSRTVVFLDTAIVPAVETRVGAQLNNRTEATIVSQIVDSLIACGLSGEEVGVISPYRSQLRVLSGLLIHHPTVEVNTVDRYQGRDKACIVISLVRSNAEGSVGDLLNDWRRVNVAFTRARTKVLVVGSRKTLEGAGVFREFFKLADGRGWVC
jgi:DNA replication ATP-dependent helicase Dna2